MNHVLIFNLFVPKDSRGNEYDLSHLIRYGGDRPWVAIDTDVVKSRSFYINICRPLPLLKDCPGQYVHPPQSVLTVSWLLVTLHLVP